MHKLLAIRKKSCYPTQVNKIRKFFGVGCNSLLAVKSATRGRKQELYQAAKSLTAMADSVKVRDQQ